jgi:hypothetical protein
LVNVALTNWLGQPMGSTPRQVLAPVRWWEFQDAMSSGPEYGLLPQALVGVVGGGEDAKDEAFGAGSPCGGLALGLRGRPGGSDHKVPPPAETLVNSNVSIWTSFVKTVPRVRFRI